jgi:hypothetical protein
MLGGCKRERGVQIKSGSAEPGARSAPAHGKAVLGVCAGGVAPPATGVRGYNPRKIFEIVYHVQGAISVVLLHETLVTKSGCFVTEMS